MANGTYLRQNLTVAQAPSNPQKGRGRQTPPTPRRQRLMRDIALILIAPLLLYLMASLFTFSPTDPGWSHSGSVTAPLHNSAAASAPGSPTCCCT